MHDQKSEIRNELSDEEGPDRRHSPSKIEAAIKEFQAQYARDEASKKTAER